MKKRLLFLLLPLLTVLFYINHINSFTILANPFLPPGPELCQNEVLETSYGSPEYQWDTNGANVRGPGTVYDQHLDNASISASQLLYIITPLYTDNLY